MTSTTEEAPLPMAEPRRTKKHNYVPNTYIVQCRNMIMADIWAELGCYGLQFLRTIHLGPNSSHYNYLMAFDAKFLENVHGKDIASGKVVPLPRDAMTRGVVPGRSWSKAVTAGRGRGGRGGDRKGKTTDRSSSSPEDVELVVKEEVLVAPEEPVVVPQPEDTHGEVVLKGVVSGTSFNLRPFFVSSDFDFKTRSGVLIVPHIIVMYPRNPSYSSALYRKWLESAVQSLVSAGILPPDSYRIITDVLDKHHLRRVETNNAFIQFKANVSHEARNAVYAILRHSLWFFSLSTDSFDPTLIETNTPCRVMCQWKIARNVTTRE